MARFVKAVYVNLGAATSRDRRARIVALVERTELNSLVIDVRSSGGPLLLEGDDASRAALSALRAGGIYLIARVVAFKGGPRGWYDPASRARWQEIAEISARALDLGFDEINYDYVRYGAANEPRSSAPTSQRISTIRAFFGYLREQVAERRGCPISADVFGVALLAPQPAIGQRLEDAAEFFDYVMPMPYPSHWGPGSFGVANPAHHPYRVVREALTLGARRVAELPGRIAALRGWIQAFDLDSSRPMRRYDYTPWHVREQIRACDDAGCAGWAAWNGRSVYDGEAFVAPPEVG